MKNNGAVKAFCAYGLKENETANSKIKSTSFGLEDEMTGIEEEIVVEKNGAGCHELMASHSRLVLECICSYLFLYGSKVGIYLL